MAQWDGMNFSMTLEAQGRHDQRRQLTPSPNRRCRRRRWPTRFQRRQSTSKHVCLSVVKKMKSCRPATYAPSTANNETRRDKAWEYPELLSRVASRSGRQYKNLSHFFGLHLSLAMSSLVSRPANVAFRSAARGAPRVVGVAARSLSALSRSNVTKKSTSSVQRAAATQVST